MEILVLSLVVLIFFIIDTIYIDYFKYKKGLRTELERIDNFLYERAPKIKQFSIELAKAYQCPFCKGPNVDTNVVSISGPEYSQISKKKPHKFLKSSCTSCGFSEYFNINIMWGPDGLDPLPLDHPIYEKFRHMCDVFRCNKCQGEEAVTKTITLKKKGLRHLINIQPSEYVCLCCNQCGWTIFFDVDIILKKEKKHA